MFEHDTQKIKQLTRGQQKGQNETTTQALAQNKEIPASQGGINILGAKIQRGGIKCQRRQMEDKWKERSLGGPNNKGIASFFHHLPKSRLGSSPIAP